MLWNVKPDDNDAEVPSELVMVTSAEPEARGGVTATSVVEFVRLTELAGSPPIVTDTPERKSAPLMVTAVPPAAGPEMGESLLTVRLADV